MTILLKIIYGQDTYSEMYFGVCLSSWHLCSASFEILFLAIGQILTFLLRFLLLGTHHVLILVIFLLGWGLI